MKRSELEHILRAASAVTLQDEFVVVGSQRIAATALEQEQHDLCIRRLQRISGETAP